MPLRARPSGTKRHLLMRGRRPGSRRCRLVSLEPRLSDNWRHLQACRSERGHFLSERDDLGVLEAVLVPDQFGLLDDAAGLFGELSQCAAFELGPGVG